jgi:hypothetical protein
MRLTAWLLLAGPFVHSPVSAQQKDSSFKNVEYLGGTSMMQEKKKGVLVVSATDVRLVDKKGEPYFVIPLTAVRAVADSTAVKQSKKGASGVGAEGGSLSAIKGLFGKKGPEQQIILSMEKDSVQEKIRFKTHEDGDGRRIAARIRTALGLPDPVAASRPNAGAQEAAQSADTTSAAPLLMIVANPFAAAPADSAAAVEVGSAIRDQVTKFVGDKFQVVTREQMNKALEPYGYPADAILSQSLAVTLAKTLQAPILIAGEMTKGSDGRYTASMRLGGVDDTTATPVTTVQNSGESLADFGRRVADSLKGPQPAPVE